MAGAERTGQCIQGSVGVREAFGLYPIEDSANSDDSFLKPNLSILIEFIS